MPHERQARDVIDEDFANLRPGKAISRGGGDPGEKSQDQDEIVVKPHPGSDDEIRKQRQFFELPLEHDRKARHHHEKDEQHRAQPEHHEKGGIHEGLPQLGPDLRFVFEFLGGVSQSFAKPA